MGMKWKIRLRPGGIYGRKLKQNKRRGKRGRTQKVQNQLAIQERSIKANTNHNQSEA